MRFVLLVILCASVSARAADAARQFAGQVVSVQGRVLIRTEAKDTTTSRFMKVGDKVFEGDVINTPSDGSAKLLLQDKTILDIGASALFNVNKFKANGGGDRDVDLGMMYGTVRANVTQKIAAAGKFKIRTPSATMGVRGTEFMVKTALNDAPQGKPETAGSQGNHRGGGNNGKGGGNQPAPPKTEIVVLQGKVEVAQNKSPASGSAAGTAPRADGPVVALTAGQKLVADSTTTAPAQAEQLTQAQAQAYVAEAKIADNTFKTAVTLDLANGPAAQDQGGADAGRGPASDTGVANVTAGIIQDTVAAVADAASSGSIPSISAGDVGFIGTFGADQGLAPAPIQIIAGGLRKVTVRIHK